MLPLVHHLRETFQPPSKTFLTTLASAESSACRGDLQVTRLVFPGHLHSDYSAAAGRVLSRTGSNPIWNDIITIPGGSWPSKNCLIMCPTKQGFRSALSQTTIPPLRTQSAYEVCCRNTGVHLASRPSKQRGYEISQSKIPSSRSTASLSFDQTGKYESFVSVQRWREAWNA
jgi:hypothetical protein